MQEKNEIAMFQKWVDYLRSSSYLSKDIKINGMNRGNTKIEEIMGQFQAPLYGGTSGLQGLS